MNKSNWFWPDVSNAEEAKKACHVAMWCAIFVAGVTAAVAILAMTGAKMNNLPVDGSALIDAALFGGIAFGLYRCSRFAGVAGFVLFLIERIYMISKTGPTGGGLFLGVFLLLGFLNGLRGALAYHKVQTQSAVPLTTSQPFS